MSAHETSTPHPISIDDSLDPAVVDSPTRSDCRHDRVARLAHQYWQARGCVDGHDVEDWLRAEHEISEHERHELDSKRTNAASS